MLDQNAEYYIIELIIFFTIWYIFTIITSGTAAPLGIFLPCMIIGCAIGHIYANISIALFPDDPNIHSQSYAIIGAASMLSGSTRMTYSLAVLMMETTSNVHLFLPMIFSLFVSYGISSLFN